MFYFFGETQPLQMPQWLFEAAKQVLSLDAWNRGLIGAAKDKLLVLAFSRNV